MSKKKSEFVAAVFEPVITEPVVETVVEAPVVTPSVHIVADGETYASIAGMYKPAGITKHEYAKHLFAVNKGKALNIGTEVFL